MPSTNLLEAANPPAYVYAIRLLTALGLCIAAWLPTCQKTPKSERSVKARPAQTDSSHSTGKVHFDLLAKLLYDDRRGISTSDLLQELNAPGAAFRAETQSHPLLGKRAPDFTLFDQRGQEWSLQGQLERGPVVLVFYLGYACDACVSNLFELNADLERFHSLGAEAVAVSGDSADLTRRRFEEYGAFGFPVLCDPGHAVARCYGTFQPVKGSEPEKLLHGTFLIGCDGHVRWVGTGDMPFRNSKALLYELARLEGKLSEPQAIVNAGGKEPGTP